MENYHAVVAKNNNDHNTSKTIMIPAPQQRNDYDCGVFMCSLATFVSIDVSITVFDQGYINAYYAANGTVVR